MGKLMRKRVMVQSQLASAKLTYSSIELDFWG